MTKSALERLGRSLFIATAATVALAGCGNDTPLEPRPHLKGEPRAEAFVAPDLGSCDTLHAPLGSKLAFHAYATGVQIYRWNGTSWTLVAPSAVLYADANGRGQVGTHFAGPTWQSVSGSTVVGAVIDRCTPDPTAIPWLSLRATPTGGPGIFHRVAFIQRVNTVGGTAPSGAGNVVGEEARVPYNAEYFFYRAP
jgi:hypothetical protein